MRLARLAGLGATGHYFATYRTESTSLPMSCRPEMAWKPLRAGSRTKSWGHPRRRLAADVTTADEYGRPVIAVPTAVVCPAARAALTQSKKAAKSVRKAFELPSELHPRLRFPANYCVLPGSLYERMTSVPSLKTYFTMVNCNTLPKTSSS